MHSAKSRRILVVGTGSAGMRHLRLLQAIPDVRLTAVPARPWRVTELRASGFDSTADLAEALRSGPDGAVIATDTGRHDTDTLACLVAGVSVLVEKPMAPDAKRAHEVRSVARVRNRSVHVACCLRFDPGLRWIRERLPAVGRPEVAEVECRSWLPDWRPGRDWRSGYATREGEGGVLLDQIHEIDVVLWLLGRPRRISARLSNSGRLGLPTPIEDTAVIETRGPDGPTASIRLSFADRNPSRRLRIRGERGRLEWDALTRVAYRRDAAGREIESTSWDRPEAMYEAQATSWFAALDGRPDSTLADVDSGVAALEVCDAARVSSASSSVVELP